MELLHALSDRYNQWMLLKYIFFKKNFLKQSIYTKKNTVFFYCCCCLANTYIFKQIQQKKKQIKSIQFSTTNTNNRTHSKPTATQRLFPNATPTVRYNNKQKLTTTDSNTNQVQIAWMWLCQNRPSWWRWMIFQACVSFLVLFTSKKKKEEKK